jgi:hypothetical protein
MKGLVPGLEVKLQEDDRKGLGTNISYYPGGRRDASKLR